jgi:tetratricopeptide (TPR) repeat protein
VRTGDRRVATHPPSRSGTSRFDERVGRIVSPVEPIETENFRLGDWLVHPRLRSENSRAIADEIQVTLTAEEEAVLADAPTVKPEAFNLYLRGNHHASQINLAAAIDDFQQSFDIDPSIAPAWGGLALATCFRFTWIGGNEEPALVIPTAECAVRRALALDATEVNAHLALAYITGSYHWRWQEAESWFRRALDIEPTLGAPSPSPTSSSGWIGATRPNRSPATPSGRTPSLRSRPTSLRG